MPNWSVAFFSITAFGRIAVPLLTELTENEITNILTHSETRALFVSRRLLAKVPKALLDSMRIVIATDDLSILKAEDDAYTYAFIGWNPTIVAAVADADYTAQFTSTPKQQGIEDLPAAEAPTKILIDNIIYILRGDKIFTITGTEVK